MLPVRDTVVHYHHSMLTPEAIDRGSVGPGDIESEVVLYLAADRRQRHEQKLIAQGGGPVPENRRGRWTVMLYQPKDQGRYLSYALDLDRRGMWTSMESEPFRMSAGAQRVGTDELLGRSCTVWRHTDAHQHTEGCYDDAGVALRLIIRMQPAIVSFEAIKIVEKSIETELLTPPDWPLFDGGAAPPVPTIEQVLAESEAELLYDCRQDADCLSAQAAFTQAWPRAQAGDRAALGLVSRCLSSNCEGAVRIVPAIGCVYAAVLEKLDGPKRPDGCYRDTTVPQQSFIIDASRVLMARMTANSA